MKMNKAHILTLIYFLLASMPLFSAVKLMKGTVYAPSKKEKVLQLTLSKGWTAKYWKNEMIIIPPSKYPHIQLWEAKGITNISEAEKNIAKIIKSEVLKFKTTETKKMSVTGTEAKRLHGTGLEADDQDPSSADVYIFSVSGKVFILIVHGEGDEAEKQRKAVAEILATAKSSK